MENDGFNVNDEFMVKLLGVDGARNYYYGVLANLILESTLESLENALIILEDKFRCEPEQNEEYKDNTYYDIDMFLINNGMDIETAFTRRELGLIKGNFWSSLYQEVSDHIQFKEKVIYG